MNRHLLARLPLPRSVSLGLAGPFIRPSRSATMAAALVLGTIGVTCGVGLAISLGEIQHGVNRKSPGAVVVQVFGPPAPPVPGENSQPTRAGNRGLTVQRRRCTVEFKFVAVTRRLRPR
ncbi:hypothetical protein [Streptomyces mirabilis]|uniref:hypothetical protein n=1 Tax=Streptomyces mirabilis TaxID=68239 RepID=UPI00365499F1